MPRTERRKSASGFYHVVMRGNGRQNLFEDDADRRSFLSYLRGDAERFGVRVLAWCLMSNHIHLLLEDRDDNLSEMMRSLATSYALRFNRRGGHAGHVFQQRFYSNPIEDEAYLLQAMRYIHDNPAESGVCPADEYPWSSYHEYVGTSEYADTGLLLEMLGGPERFAEFSARGWEGTYRLPGRPRVPDAMVGSVAGDVLGALPASELKALDKGRRNALLRRLWEEGLSVRQIERLTGIGRGTVHAAVRT